MPASITRRHAQWPWASCTSSHRRKLHHEANCRGVRRKSKDSSDVLRADRGKGWPRWWVRADGGCRQVAANQPVV